MRYDQNFFTGSRSNPLLSILSDIDLNLNNVNGYLFE